MEMTEVKTRTLAGRAGHLFGLCWFDLFHFVGLHLGLQVLPVLAYSALFGAHPGEIFAGFADGGNVADALLRWRLHGFTCRTTQSLGFPCEIHFFSTTLCGSKMVQTF